MLMTVIVLFSATSVPKKGSFCVDTTTSNATITNFLLFSCIPLTSLPELHLKTHHFQACWIVAMMMMPVVITDTPITNPSRGPSCPPSSRVFFFQPQNILFLISPLGRCGCGSCWGCFHGYTLTLQKSWPPRSAQLSSAQLGSARLSSAPCSTTSCRPLKPSRPRVTNPQLLTDSTNGCISMYVCVQCVCGVFMSIVCV